MKKMKYEGWEIHPEIVVKRPAPSTTENVICMWMSTKHEGNILYWKLWNFWVRTGTKADMRSDEFFRDYERSNANTKTLFRAIGVTSGKAETEDDVWNNIGIVWNWLKENVQVTYDENIIVTSVDNSWPSILDYAKYYAQNGHLVWKNCFSKAHLFATLLGLTIRPRYRFAIATCHHTENGAPPTASHVYVSVYVGDRWFYLDPLAVYSTDFPNFVQRKSIGIESFDTVDYQHPHELIPVPLSGFDRVPYLPD